MSFNDVASAYVKGSAYRIHFQPYTKSDAISKLNNSNLVDKKVVLYFFLLYIKNEYENVSSKKQRFDTE